MMLCDGEIISNNPNDYTFSITTEDYGKITYQNNEVPEYSDYLYTADKSKLIKSAYSYVPSSVSNIPEQNMIAPSAITQMVVTDELTGGGLHSFSHIPNSAVSKGKGIAMAGKQGLKDPYAYTKMNLNLPKKKKGSGFMSEPKIPAHKNDLYESKKFDSSNTHDPAFRLRKQVLHFK